MEDEMKRQPLDSAAYGLLQHQDTSDQDMSEMELEKQRASPPSCPSRAHRYATCAVRGIIMLLCTWGFLNISYLIINSAAPGYFTAPASRPAGDSTSTTTSTSTHHHYHAAGPAIQPMLPASDDENCWCGASVAEAAANGCRFDPIASAWLPDRCIDHPLTDEFNAMGPNDDGTWPYYADPQRSRQLTLAEVGAIADGVGQYYVSQDWHVTHCLFNWRKLWRRTHGESDIVLNKRDDRMSHIKHCEMILRRRTPLEKIAVEAGVALDADRAHADA